MTTDLDEARSPVVVDEEKPVDSAVGTLQEDVKNALAELRNQRTKASASLFVFDGFREAMEAANMICDSKLVPEDFRSDPASIVVAWQFGAELGLQPMAALRYVSVVNGRPSLWGDGALAVVMSHPEFVDMREWEDDGTAFCMIQRRGREPVTQTFSVDDAEKANLGGSEKGAMGAVHKTYPKRMRQWRARHLAMRDAFPDALSGIWLEHEARDAPVKDVEAVSVPPASIENKSGTAKAKEKLEVAAAAPPPAAPSGDAQAIIGNFKASIERAKTPQALGAIINGIENNTVLTPAQRQDLKAIAKERREQQGAT